MSGLASIRHPLPWLLFITGLGYLRLAGVDFSWDDEALILNNPFLSSSRLSLFFTQDLWQSCVADLNDLESGYYRPLVMISWAVEHMLFCGIEGAHVHSLVPMEQWSETCLARFGDAQVVLPPAETDPWSAASHLISLAWHLLATGLLFGLLNRLVDRGPALAGATLFALHPVQTEVLALVAARNDSMAAAMLLGTIWLLEARSRPSPLRLGASCVLLLGALLSKESAILAPLFLLMLDLGRWRRPGHWTRYIGLVVGTIAYLLLRSLAELEGSIWPTAQQQEMVFSNLGSIGGTYAGMLVWPWPLSPARHVEYLPDLPSLLPACAALVLLTALGLRRGKSPWLCATGLIWALLALAPSLAATMDKGLLGERYLYLPMAGLGLALGAALHTLPRTPFLVLGGLAAVLIQLRIPQWQNSRAVWSAAHQAAPTPYTAGGLAWYLHRDGTRMNQEESQAQADLQASLPLFRLALTGSPPYRKACPLGIQAYLQAEDWAGAASLGEEIWTQRTCHQMQDSISLQRGEALVSTGEWVRSLEVLLTREARQQLLLRFPAQLSLADGEEDARLSLVQALRYQPGATLEYIDSLGTSRERPAAEVLGIEVLGIMKLEPSSIERPLFIIQEDSLIGELSAQAWRTASLRLGIREPTILPLGTGLKNAPAIIRALGEQQPSLVMLATAPSLTRDLVKEARHSGVARGRAWLTLPGRVNSKNHAAIEDQPSLPLIIAALTGLDEQDATRALVHAHPEPGRLRGRVLELLQRTQHDTRCSDELLFILETEGSEIMLEEAEDRMASGECDFRTPVLDHAARAHFRSDRWTEGLFASMGAATLRSLDSISEDIRAAQSPRALLIHGPGLLGQVSRQAWQPALQQQGIQAAGIIQWNGQDPSESMAPIRELQPDLVMLALLPQDAAELRPHLEQALPESHVLEILALQRPELRSHPGDNPALVAVGAWLLTQGRTADLHELLSQVAEPMAFMHAMEATAAQADRSP